MQNNKEIFNGVNEAYTNYGEGITPGMFRILHNRGSYWLQRIFTEQQITYKIYKQLDTGGRIHNSH